MINVMNMKRYQLIAAKAQTNTATASASWDTLGSDWATITLNFGIELNTNAVGPTISVLESDDTVVTNHATIVANRTAEDLVAAKNVHYDIDLRARKRYLRLTVTTATATNDDVTFAAFGTLSRLENSPDSTTDRVNSTNDVVVSVLT